MLLELCHKALAESHHFVVRLSLRVEVRTTFTCTHRQGSEAVLESLLEGKELHNAEIHTRMEADSTFVWTDCTVTLNSVASVDAHFSFVIKPRHAENDDSFRFYDSFKNLHIHKVGVFNDIRRYADEHFVDCLMKFLFSWISGNKVSHKSIYILLCELVHSYIYLLGLIRF